ncbi:hypothetical protein BC629DRAFT_1598793 [Irpex lacteus]|nr:hypothetical protein BC629DRAFT_1598793 [Irpex lacteus]
MASKTRKGLENLPYDILHNIVHLLYANERRPPGGRSKFTATWILSRVCRSLRAVALSFIIRNVTLKPHKELAAAIAEFLPGGHYEHLATSVRSLSMSRTSHVEDVGWCFAIPLLVLPSSGFPFVNLTSLEFPHNFLDKALVTALSYCTQLSALAVACNNEWPSFMLEKLPRLATVRLYIAVEHRTTERATANQQPETSYPRIATLALHSLPSGPPHLVQQCIKSCRFPSLRVLLIQGFNTYDINDVFYFIHQHPTLLEVNVNTGSKSLDIRIEAIMKLLDGTGTWVKTNNSAATLCRINYSLLEPEPLDLFPPNISPGVAVFCNAFAFTRVPLYQDAILDTSLSNCNARYRCTSLALHELSEHPIPGENDVSGVIQALAYMAQVAPEIEELRLRIDGFALTTQYMNWIGPLLNDVVHRLTHLRKLALYWNCRGGDPGYTARWGYRHGHGGNVLSENRYIPVLDDVRPPIWTFHPEIPHTIKTVSLAELICYPHLPLAKIVAGVLQTLELSEDDELDIFDETLVMRAWEARNEDYAQWIAGIIGSSCPELVEFDWYFLSDRQFVLSTYHDHIAAVWRWKFLRNKENPHLCDARGTLMWTGGISGEARPLYPLLGQELRRTMDSELGDRAWPPFQA